MDFEKVKEIVSNKTISVFNVPDTKDENPKHVGENSWLDYWKSKSGRPQPKECSACKKVCNDLDGGHVHKKGNKEQWYIVPLCKECNNCTNFKEMQVQEDMLVKVGKVGK